MFGFNHHHDHPHGRHGGGRHGTIRRGPFELSWSLESKSGRHGGRRRLFDGGELRLVLLALLEAQPRHGYDLIREIEERTGGAYAPSPGVVYPTLTMLDELGQLDEVKEEGARRRFAITAAGHTHLEERRNEAEALLVRLDELGRARAQSDRAPISRAMANLHLALRNALGSAGETRQDAIVAILDEAARQIERGR